MSYWDDYYEPSEFDGAMEELKKTIRDNVRDEIKNEIFLLKSELAQLQDVKANWQAMQREHEQKKREMNNAIENAMREARKMRMTEIMADFQQEYWGIENVGIEKPKCDKCDADRYIHFQSPSGKDLKEECECKKKLPLYKPHKQCCVEIDFRDGKMKGYYESHRGHDNDYYTSSHSVDDKLYRGEPFDQIKVPSWDISYPWFKTEEEAQAYCDYLNN